jgi:glutathione peroxidase
MVATAHYKELIMTSVYDFKLKEIRGKEKSLADYKGKVLLIVNVASKCGLTPQYKGLQELYDKYHERGLEILGVPSNDFMGQEPGTEQEIVEFCDMNYGVKFDMFSKVKVKGDDKVPLYKFLTEESEQPGEIQWNFQKFLVDRTGKVVANIHPKTEPKDIEKQIAALL